MIVIDHCLVTDELSDVCFVCDLEKCKGACCVEGDAGAPLTEEEISILEDAFIYVKPYMTEQGIREVEQNGVFDYDMVGNYATALVNGCECAFTNFTDGVAWCAIEKAWSEGKISFQKPISCHLYPIRLSSLRSGDAINYHKWNICKPALKKGKVLNVPLYKFLKEPLVRKYGEVWYQQLVDAIEA